MSKRQPINVGDVFTHTFDKVTWTCERLPDDERGRPRIRAFGCSIVPEGFLQVFTTEPEWFRQRGLEMGQQAGLPL